MGMVAVSCYPEGWGRVTLNSLWKLAADEKFSLGLLPLSGLQGYRCAGQRFSAWSFVT
jgi:hypothetical protein